MHEAVALLTSAVQQGSQGLSELDLFAQDLRRLAAQLTAEGSPVPETKARLDLHESLRTVTTKTAALLAVDKQNAAKVFLLLSAPPPASPLSAHLSSRRAQLARSW